MSSQANNSPVAPSSSKLKPGDKVSPNPIPYLVYGVSNLFTSNLKSFFGTIFLSLLAPIITVLLAIILLFSFDNLGDLFDSFANNIWTLIAGGIALFIAFVIGNLAYNHVLVLGSRKESTTTADALTFALHRFLPMLGVSLLILLVFSAPILLTVWLMISVHAVFMLLLVPFIIFAIVGGYYLTPLQNMLADSRPLHSLGNMLSRLQKMWKAGFLAMAIYILLMGFLSGGISTPFSSMGSFSSPSTPRSSGIKDYNETETENKGWKFSDSKLQFVKEDVDSVKDDLYDVQFNGVVRVVSVVIGVFILISMVVFSVYGSFLPAGFARLYNVVSDRVEGKKTTATS